VLEFNGIISYFPLAGQSSFVSVLQRVGDGVFPVW